MTIRAVIDTNVFVGACMCIGASAQVVAAAFNGRIQPLMGVALFAEYEDVLSRSNLFDGCRLSAEEREELLDIFVARCEWTRVYFAWRPNLADEADNHLIELAIAGNASHIVTRNLRDFTRAELAFPDLRIRKPEVFLSEELR